MTQHKQIMKRNINIILIGIDIGKSSHIFCIFDQSTGHHYFILLINYTTSMFKNVDKKLNKNIKKYAR